MTSLTLPTENRRAMRKLSDPPPAAPSAGGRDRGRAGRVVMYVLLILSAIGLLMPFFWMVMSSLKTPNEVFTVPVKWIPDTFIWSNYVAIWTESNMLVWIRNTLLLAVVVTFLQVLTGSFAAYGFARMRFAGRDVLFLAYIGTIAVPWQSYMIPQFILLSNLRVSNAL